MPPLLASAIWPCPWNPYLPGGDSGGQAGKVDHRSCLRQPGGTTASPPGCDLDSSGQPPGTARDRLGCDLV